VAGRREPDDLPPAVGRRPLAGGQPVGGEPVQDPAEVSGVEVQVAAQVQGVDRLALGQLEEDPRLGQRVRRVEQAAAEQPEHVGVEAAEPADRRHGVCHA
jgi:hypothetical protein